MERISSKIFNYPLKISKTLKTPLNIFIERASFIIFFDHQFQIEYSVWENYVFDILIFTNSIRKHIL